MHGLVATFMGRRVEGGGTSGYHLHISAWEDGRRTSSRTPPARTASRETARIFVGGVLEHARGTTAVMAPTVNAYKRFVAQELAPYWIDWGPDNRSVYVRIPVERGQGDADRVPRQRTARRAPTSPRRRRSSPDWTASIASSTPARRREASTNRPWSGRACPSRSARLSTRSRPTRSSARSSATSSSRPSSAIKRNEVRRFMLAVTDWEIHEYAGGALSLSSSGPLRRATSARASARVEVDVGARPVALCCLDGTFYAFDDMCTHRGCLLSRASSTATWWCAPVMRVFSTSGPARWSRGPRRGLSGPTRYASGAKTSRSLRERRPFRGAREAAGGPRPRADSRPLPRRRVHGGPASGSPGGPPGRRRAAAARPQDGGCRSRVRRQLRARGLDLRAGARAVGRAHRPRSRRRAPPGNQLPGAPRRSGGAPARRARSALTRSSSSASRRFISRPSGSSPTVAP